jgi:hypothetical protein
MIRLEHARWLTGEHRHELISRLMRLEQHAQGDTVVLSETQIRLHERHSAEFRCRHVEASRPWQPDTQ